MIARVEGVGVSEVIRAGVYRHLSSLRTDPAFENGFANAWTKIANLGTYAG